MGESQKTVQEKEGGDGDGPQTPGTVKFGKYQAKKKYKNKF